jgi:hypothetical protein
MSIELSEVCYSSFTVHKNLINLSELDRLIVTGFAGVSTDIRYKHIPRHITSAVIELYKGTDDLGPEWFTYVSTTGITLLLVNHSSNCKTLYYHDEDLNGVSVVVNLSDLPEDSILYVYLNDSEIDRVWIQHTGPQYLIIGSETKSASNYELLNSTRLAQEEREEREYAESSDFVLDTISKYNAERNIIKAHKEAGT